MGKIYYKGLNFTTQAVLVLALHIVVQPLPHEAPAEGAG